MPFFFGVLNVGNDGLEEGFFTGEGGVLVAFQDSFQLSEPLFLVSGQRCMDFAFRGGDRFAEAGFFMDEDLHTFGEHGAGVGAVLQQSVQAVPAFPQLFQMALHLGERGLKPGDIRRGLPGDFQFQGLDHVLQLAENGLFHKGELAPAARAVK